MQSASLMPTTSQPNSQRIPLASSRSQEVGSSSIPLVTKRQPRVEVSQTYKKGTILVFPPEIAKDMPTPKPLTRSQAERLPKEATVEEV